MLHRAGEYIVGEEHQQRQEKSLKNITTEVKCFVENGFLSKVVNLQSDPFVTKKYKNHTSE